MSLVMASTIILSLNELQQHPSTSLLLLLLTYPVQAVPKPSLVAGNFARMQVELEMPIGLFSCCK